MPDPRAERRRLDAVHGPSWLPGIVSTMHSLRRVTPLLPWTDSLLVQLADSRRGSPCGHDVASS